MGKQLFLFEIHECICTKVCDCESPDTEPALCSNECPIHNIYPYPQPHPDCMMDKHWWENLP